MEMLWRLACEGGIGGWGGKGGLEEGRWYWRLEGVCGGWKRRNGSSNWSSEGRYWKLEQEGW